MTQGLGGDPAALAAHLAAVQVAGVSLDHGVTVLPFAELAHTAIDPRIPLLVNRLPAEGSAAAQQVGTLPGRSGAGWALLADRKSTRLNSSHVSESRMPSSA